MTNKEKAATAKKGDSAGLDLHELWLEVAGDDAEFIVKKNEVGSDLAALVAFARETRSAVANRLAWKESRMCKVLSGNENLTLKTIFELAHALGYDFQVVLKAAGQHRIPQPWEHQSCVYEIHNHLSAARAMLETARAINRQAFKMPRAPQNFVPVKVRIPASEANDAPFSATA